MTVPPAVRRAVWAAISTSCALLLGSFFCHPVGALTGALFVAVAVLTAFRPYQSLMLVAAFAPLSTILFVVLGVRAGGLRVVEGLTLAFLAGWAAHRAVRPDEVRVLPALRWNATALVVAAVASAFVSASVLFAERGGPAAADVREWFQSYAVHLDPITFALHFAEGVLMMLAVADVCAGNAERRDGVVRTMVVGASAAAVFNLLRLLIDGALRTEEPLRQFVSLLFNMRVNVHHTDMNAAGSYFALCWFLALGLAARHRVAGGICLLLVSAGLWIVGSRVALASTLLVAAVMVAYPFTRNRPRTTIIATLAIAALAGVALWMFPSARHSADPSLALRIRMALSSGAVAMSADHPLFGVGIGHFYELSNAYAKVPNYIVRENAHNNFLQVLAELGLAGFWLFLAVIASALSRLRQESDTTAWSLAAGIGAFLLTCIGGHPLLVPLVAIPFWMAVGLAGAFGGQPVHSALRVIAIGLALFFVLTLPLRSIAAVRSANRENTSAGLSAWQRDETGQRFRWAHKRASFYVPSSARVVGIPLRHGGDAPPRLQVRILLDGREANRVELPAGGGWSIVRLIMPERTEASYARVDLETAVPATPTGLEQPGHETPDVLMVGRPEIRQ